MDKDEELLNEELLSEKKKELIQSLLKDKRSGLRIKSKRNPTTQQNLEDFLGYLIDLVLKKGLEYAISENDIQDYRRMLQSSSSDTSCFDYLRKMSGCEADNKLLIRKEIPNEKKKLDTFLFYCFNSEIMKEPLYTRLFKEMWTLLPEKKRKNSFLESATHSSDALSCPFP